LGVEFCLDTGFDDDSVTQICLLREAVQIVLSLQFG
jgi:hypothetical protein